MGTDNRDTRLLESEGVSNPFRIGGVVTGEYFTDRERERARIRRALTEPQAHLLVYGPRRMGKTSTLAVVRDELAAEKRPVVLADLSTASTLTDAATRILQSATRALGRQWRNIWDDLVAKLQFRVSVTPDPSTGIPIPTVDVALRDAEPAVQQATLVQVLDAIERLAADRDAHVGLVLDEFQEIGRLGGVPAEGALRGTIQHHRHVSYVLAGSDERLIDAMTGRDRPLYRLLERLHFGPIDPVHLASWIDERMRGAGVDAGGAGEAIVGIAGPRTRDIVQLARATFEVATAEGGGAAGAVERAFRHLIEEEEVPLRIIWEGLSSLQQNVLRALAVRSSGLTTTSTRNAFALGATGAATKAVQTLLGRDLVVRTEAGYIFDSPFFRGWVLLRTLPDLGLALPVLHDPAGDRRLPPPRG